MVNQGTVLGTVRWYGGRVQRYGIGRYSSTVYGGTVQRCDGAVGMMVRYDVYSLRWLVYDECSVHKAGKWRSIQVCKSTLPSYLRTLYAHSATVPSVPYKCTVPTSIVDHRKVFGVRRCILVFVPQKPYDDLRCSWVRCIGTVQWTVVPSYGDPLCIHGTETWSCPTLICIVPIGPCTSGREPVQM